MTIQIDVDKKGKRDKWMVCVRFGKTRGYNGFPEFTHEIDARLAAEGIAACFSKLGAPVLCNYSTVEKGREKTVGEILQFERGVYLFLSRIVGIQDEEMIKTSIRSAFPR